MPQVFGVAQTAVTLSSVHDGMGKNGLLLSSGEVDSALKVSDAYILPHNMYNISSRF